MRARAWQAGVRRVIPLILALLRPPYKQPVVDIAKGVWHEGLRFIVTPFAIHNKLVLVVAAGESGSALLCNLIKHP